MFQVLVVLSLQFVFLLNAYANADYLAWAQKSCQHIAKVYSSCEQQVVLQENHIMIPNENKSYLCTDGSQKSFYNRVKEMDIASIMMIPYKLGQIILPETGLNYDPGRLRHEEFLKDIFGHSEDEVRQNLVVVDFLGQKILFQKKLGAAQALQNVSNQIKVEITQNKEVKEFLKVFIDHTDKPSTFNWRNIAGTNRLSTHSFGTAIDLIVPSVKSQYWLWDEKKNHPDLAKQGEVAYEHIHYISNGKPYFHPRVVEIFEQNGFIWGGKWNHYDTMHFEYRPEFFKSLKITCQK